MLLFSSFLHCVADDTAAGSSWSRDCLSWPLQPRRNAVLWRRVDNILRFSAWKFTADANPMAERDRDKCVGFCYEGNESKTLKKPVLCLWPVAM